MDQEKKLTYEANINKPKAIGEKIMEHFTVCSIVILILLTIALLSDTGKQRSAYELAYKQLLKHDKEITDLIEDLNKFKTEELKQRKYKLLEDYIWNSEKIINEAIEDKTLESRNFPAILQADVFIHDEEIKLLREEIDRLKQKLEAKK